MFPSQAKYLYVPRRLWCVNISRAMKTAVLIVSFALLTGLQINAQQMCPGGGVNFNGAVMFDPSWIYGCNTGTSCNGGTAFDNRAACQPTTSLDACAPAPSCGSPSNDASNVWFKFYPSASTAVISCFQNTSLVLGVQAFSGGPSCGSLTEIGCAKSGGPSSGVKLTLNGLQPGQIYYFRIFGSAGPVSQRTGLYCFCGSIGLGNYNLLPIIITDFKVTAANNKTSLSWSAASVYPGRHIEVERSTDGIAFAKIGDIEGSGDDSSRSYNYTDDLPANGINFYRLKYPSTGGQHKYSQVISIKTTVTAGFIILSNRVNQQLQVSLNNPLTLLLSDFSGHVLHTYHLPPGTQTISTVDLSNGMYCLSAQQGGMVQKFCVSR